MMTKMDENYAKGYVGRLWKDLEFEEQAHVRALVRDGELIVEGTRGERRVAWRNKKYSK